MQLQDCRSHAHNLVRAAAAGHDAYLLAANEDLLFL
jgi:hypothetical protein